MAKKKNTYTPKSKENETKVKKYKNPVNSIWGKIIIAILAIGMACSGLITLIYLIATKS